MAGATELLQTVREEDFVEYFLFPPLESSDESGQERLLSTANKIVENYTKNFLWHKDEFKLNLRTNSILDLASNTQGGKKIVY